MGAPLILLLTALAALLVPGAPSQVLGGVPLTPFGLGATAIALYAALALPRIGGRSAAVLSVAFIAVVLLKMVAGAVAPPVGLLASYWPSAVAASGGAPERSTDFLSLGDTATRIEPRLDLRGEDFGAHFFNDAARFNIGPDVQPGRDQLPFVVRWEGFLRVLGDGPRQIRIESTGPAHLWLDGVEVDPEREVALSSGPHAIRVEYVRPEAKVPSLRVQWQRTPGGTLESLGGDDVRWRPSEADPGLARALGTLADLTLAVLLATWVTLGVRALLASTLENRGVARALIGLLPLGFLLYGALLHAPLLGHATILSGLDDWLIYESSARDILLNGLLMDGGQGHAAPYYGQPLYPYALALAHRLTGEGLFGPLALQFAGLGLVVAGTALLARRAFGALVDGVAAAACLLLLLQLEPEHFKIARQLFTENIYMPLVMASLIVIVGFALRAPPALWQALAAGVLLGATAVARSQFLLFVPFGLLVLALAWRRRAPLPLALMVVGLVLAIVPVTARNVAVSGQLVLISSSGGASLLEFHRPPPGLVDADAIAKDPLFEALHLDQQTRTVLAFLRADPVGYLRTLLPLGAHSVGLQGRNDPGIYWPLLATSLLYVASFALRRTRRLHVWPIHAFVASHLAVLMLFEADTYGYRLVMPMYAPMVAVAAQVPLAALGLVFGRLRAGKSDAGKSDAVWSAAAGAGTPFDAGGDAARGEGVPVGVGVAAAGDVGSASVGSSGDGDAPSAGDGANGRYWRANGDASDQSQRQAGPRSRRLGPREFAVVGWSLVAIVAVLWQTKGLVELWPQRDAALHGLGGAAVAAAQAADASGAASVYVASIDGTPRRFGAGTLTGLRYPWFKWFDPVRSLPLPASGTSAVYLLNELQGHDIDGDLAACLGAPDASGVVTASADQVRQRCSAAGANPTAITFEGLARIDALAMAASGEAGLPLEARLVWQPLIAHPDPQQISLQLDDPQSGDGTLWGNGTLEPYPARQWQADEAILSRIPIATDPTALPQSYRVTLGLGPTKPGAPAATVLVGNTRQERVPVGSVELTQSTAPTLAQLPQDMRAIQGSLGAGGLELMAARPLPEEVAIGGPLRVGLLWRASQDAPVATGFSVRLLRANGEVVQESTLPLLGGRVAPSALHAGNVVRDEQSVTIGPRVPAEAITVEVRMGDAGVALGSVKMTGRAHQFDPTPAAPPQAVFGGAIALDNVSIDPANAKANQKVTIKLRWRAEKEIQQAYKVFVHVLDPSGTQVVAQRDAEPQDGRAPTTGWVAGETIEDEYAVTLPAQVASGEYPIEVGLYDARSGDRLTVASGENRALLAARLRVGP